MAPPVTPTGYALLGLLSFGRQLSGYELKQWADGSLRFFYAAPPMSQVYAELERLADAGLVTVRQTGSRATKRYRLSAAGRRALVRWLQQEPVEPPMLKHHLALRVFLGHLVDHDVLVRHLEAHVHWCEELLAELAAVKENLGDDPGWARARLVAEWGETYYAGEQEAARRVTDELRRQHRADQEDR